MIFKKLNDAYYKLIGHIQKVQEYSENKCRQSGFSTENNELIFSKIRKLTLPLQVLHQLRCFDLTFFYGISGNIIVVHCLIELSRLFAYLQSHILNFLHLSKLK